MPEREGGRIKGQGGQEPVKVAKECPADKNEGAGGLEVSGNKQRTRWRQAGVPTRPQQAAQRRGSKLTGGTTTLDNQV